MSMTDWNDWLAMKWMTSYRLNALRTSAYALAYPCRPTQLLFVLGCQRSGTTMLANLLGLSPLVREYGEGDAEYFRWEGAPRLRPLAEVARGLERERSPFTLLKPLCESQRAAEILEHFPSARALWIFRNYRDCVASHAKYYREFHDGLDYVREMLHTERPCWKNENLSDEVRAFLREYADRPINLETAYALYWLARNSLFERLPEGVPVKLVRYEANLQSPQESLPPLYAFAGVPYRERYSRFISPPASHREGRVRECPIDPPVARECEELLGRLIEQSRSLQQHHEEAVTA